MMKKKRKGKPFVLLGSFSSESSSADVSIHDAVLSVKHDKLDVAWHLWVNNEIDLTLPFPMKEDNLICSSCGLLVMEGTPHPDFLQPPHPPCPTGFSRRTLCASLVLSPPLSGASVSQVEGRREALSSAISGCYAVCSKMSQTPAILPSDTSPTNIAHHVKFPQGNPSCRYFISKII